MNLTALRTTFSTARQVPYSRELSEQLDIYRARCRVVALMVLGCIMCYALAGICSSLLALIALL